MPKKKSISENKISKLGGIKEKKVDVEQRFKNYNDDVASLHPLIYYINDRAEMINQVFSVIKGAKLRAMLSSVLRHMEIDELKSLCLEQLEGMSRKRIRHVLAGDDMDESSNTEDEEEEEDLDQLNQLFKGTVPVVKGDANIDASSFLSCRSGLAKHQDLTLADESHKSDETGLPVEQEVSDKIEITLDTESKSNPSVLQTESSFSMADAKKNNKEGKSLMELLELEMRARAIKSLLGNKKDGVEVSTTEHTSVVSNPVKIPEDNEDHCLMKAREALQISLDKKYQEDKETEQRHASIRATMEEQRKKMEAQLELKRIEDEKLEAKEKKKAQKNVEYQDFIKWKEEQEQKRHKKIDQQDDEYDNVDDISDTLDVQPPTSIQAREGDGDTSFNTSMANEEQCSSDNNGSRPRKQRKYRKRNDVEEEEEEEVEVGTKDESDREQSISLQPPLCSDPDFTSLSSDDEELMVERLRKSRGIRCANIIRKNRKKKRASDIEEGEVDSDGEHFEPLEDGDNEDDEDIDVGTNEAISIRTKHRMKSKTRSRKAKRSKRRRKDEESIFLPTVRTVNNSLRRTEEAVIDCSHQSAADRTASDDVKKMNSFSSSPRYDEEVINNSNERNVSLNDDDSVARTSTVADHDLNLVENSILLASSSTTFMEEEEIDQEKNCSLSENLATVVSSLENISEDELICKDIESDDEKEDLLRQRLEKKAEFLEQLSYETDKDSHDDQGDDTPLEDEIDSVRLDHSQNCEDERSCEGVNFAEEQSLMSDEEASQGSVVSENVAEMDNITWAERWYQNRKVQKVVKHSKILSKVRKKMILKGKSVQQDNSGVINQSEMVNNKIIGSMDEYANLLNVNSELNMAITNTVEATDAVPSEEDENDEEDDKDLWSAIMGNK